MRQIVTLGRAGYESGQSPLLDLLDSQRSLISLQRLACELRIIAAKRLADLEAIAAADLSRRPRTATSAPSLPQP